MRCLKKAAQPSPGLRGPLEAPLGFPAEHGTSRVLGKVGWRSEAMQAWLIRCWSDGSGCEVIGE